MERSDQRREDDESMDEASLAARLDDRYDAIVVGARCGGAATGMLLARCGLSVLVVDRSPHGSDTLSTHAIMRGGVLQLHRWGVLDAVRAAGTPPVRQTAFHYADEVITIDIPSRDGVDALYSPRRTVLDAVLADAASAAGATVLRGPRVVDVLRDQGHGVSGAIIEHRGGRVSRVRAGIVIGADGIKSTVARLVDARPYRVGQHVTGTLYRYWAGLDVPGNRFEYRGRASVGAIPTNDGLACVFAAVPRARFIGELRCDLERGYHRVLHEVDPGFATEVARATPSGPLRGFAGEPGYLRQSWGPGWALVGDAAYFRDPLIAHGITDALRDAEILARAVARGTTRALEEYQETRDDLARGLFEASDEIAGFEWDLERLKDRHLFMSREMNREASWLARLGPLPAAASGRAGRDAGTPGAPGQPAGGDPQPPPLVIAAAGGDR